MVVAQENQETVAVASLASAEAARLKIRRTTSFQPPSWCEILAGARPEALDDADKGEWKHGWQFHASSALEQTELQTLFARGRPEVTAKLRSCGGRYNGRWLVTPPTGR